MSGYHEERVPFPSPGRLRRELRLGRPPWWMVLLLVLAVVGTWVPLALVFRARATLSDRPRVHPMQDMGVQPRHGPQAPSDLFADRRAMRPPVSGTVARGRLAEDDHFYRGYRIDEDPETGEPEVHFFEGLPESVEVTDEFLQRGREMYGAFCTVCHGPDADGDSVMNQWASLNQQEGWVEAWSLLDEEVRQRADGHLYNSIRQGIRSMPPHGSQIDVLDRWAIVAYLRALHENTVETDRISQSQQPPFVGQE